MTRRACWAWRVWRWSVSSSPGSGGKIVQLVTDDPDAARCPGCQMLSSSGKDWVLTRPRDLPCGGELMSVQWRKRRWRCRAEHCPQQTFTEQVLEVPAGMRTTTRLRTPLAVAVEDGRDQSEVAAAHGVSWPTVQRAVMVHGAVELVELAGEAHGGTRSRWVRLAGVRGRCQRCAGSFRWWRRRFGSRGR
jgi:hypothetical protein